MGRKMTISSQRWRKIPFSSLLCALTNQPVLSAPGSCQVVKLIKYRDSNGTTKATMAQEIVSAAAMVTARVLEKAPVTPDRNTKGTKTIIVAKLDPVSGGKNSCPAGKTASFPSGISS